jgi:hypothetical protein
MSTYAQLGDANIVENIVVADSDWVGLTVGVWVEYSNDVNPAYIGSRYDSTTNMFEWFDETTQTWQVIYPPVEPTT